MSAQWTSNLAEFRRRHERAIRAALVAVAVLYESRVKAKMRPYYKHGRFSTGRVRSSVTHSDVVTEDGVFVIRVGTNVEYALFWEIGHQNRWSRQYERVEIWRPTMIDAAAELRAKFVEIYTAMMRRAA